MTDPRATLLLVEDAAEIRRVLRSAFEIDGYRIVEAASGRRGMIDAGTHKPDLAIVDLGLPDVDGLEVIRQLRGWSALPIIVLSARASERTKIEALDAGANDYVTKPFAIGELQARVRAALRHAVRAASGATELRFGTVAIDFDRRSASRGATSVHLTPLEFRLLATLARQLGMVVTHRQLLREIWGPTHEGDTHYLRVYMKQLRDKLEDDPVNPRYLLTETGVGYRLAGDDDGS